MSKSETAPKYSFVSGSLSVGTHNAKSQSGDTKGEVIAVVPWVSHNAEKGAPTQKDITAVINYLSENAPVLEGVSRKYELGSVIVEACNRLTGLLCVPSRGGSTATMSKTEVTSFAARIAAAQEAKNLAAFLNENIEDYRRYWEQTNKAVFTRQAKATLGLLATDKEVDTEAARLLSETWKTVETRIRSHAPKA